MDNAFYQHRLGLIDNCMVDGGQRLLPRLLPIWSKVGVIVLPEVRRVAHELGLEVYSIFQDD